VSVVVDSFVVITITIEKYFNFFQTSIYPRCFIFFLMMRKKLKSFFRFFLGHSTVQFNRMQPETTEIQNRKRRVILVKKSAKDPKDPKDAKGGMERFDEYIQKSGLEPKSYQRDGVAFCLRREQRCAGAVAVRGGIIADEMGLGKTIMMMGLILANLATYRRTLIVVPVALIAQWVAQLKKTIIDTGVKPDLSILVFHGATGKRSVVLSEVGDAMVWCHRPPKRGGGGGGARAHAIDIVITTYGCVAMEEPAPLNVLKAPKTPALSLLTFRANRVIFDEAHHLRNKTSRIFKGAMRVVAAAGAGAGEVHRPSVWIVTGTPIQNKISDLKSLCYVLGFGVGDLMTEEKRRAIRDEYVLRRTKVSVGMVAGGGAGAATGADIVCAPRLQSLKHYKSQVPWSSEHELDLSREIHQKAKNTTDRAERLKLYTRMRQMCVWPALIGGGGSGGVDGSGVDEYGLSIDEYKVAVSKQSKLDRVVATMVAEAGRSGSVLRKSIVFCHYRREMTQLRDMLLRGGCGGVVVSSEEDIAIIDGTVGARERTRIFAAAPTVLILQIRTCSEGLNLQSYSDVYFVSPHWNPCVEDQAIARCYRMGQTSQVRVFRFYMTDFVAERSGTETSRVAEAGEFDAVVAGESESISTLDHKCEEIQERKRVLCNEFLCGV
jgi:SNF2 family DNA or RNA helicase